MNTSGKEEKVQGRSQKQQASCPVWLEVRRTLGNLVDVWGCELSFGCCKVEGLTEEKSFCYLEES